MIRGSSGQLPTVMPCGPTSVVSAAVEAANAPCCSATDLLDAEARLRTAESRAQWLSWTHEVGWVNSSLTCLTQGLGYCSPSRWASSRARGASTGQAAPSTGSGVRLPSSPRFAIGFTLICTLLFASQMVAGGVQWYPSSWLVRPHAAGPWVPRMHGNGLLCHLITPTCAWLGCHSLCGPGDPAHWSAGDQGVGCRSGSCVLGTVIKLRQGNYC